MKAFTAKAFIFLSLTVSSFATNDCAKANWVFDHLDTIPDFPSPGIQFKSISPLLKDPVAFKKAIQIFADRYRDAGIDAIAGIDSRGFIFGTALAYELNVPFVMIRKAGKLPGDVVSVKYELEYAKSCLEIQKNVLLPNQKVVVMDDIIVTGGTIKAAGYLIEQLGAEVYEVAALLEIMLLNGRAKIPYPVFTLAALE